VEKKNIGMSVIIISNGRNGKEPGCTGTVVWKTISPTNAPIHTIIKPPPIVDMIFVIKAIKIAFRLLRLSSFL
jgi:hypothetical protein